MTVYLKSRLTGRVRLADDAAHAAQLIADHGTDAEAGSEWAEITPAEAAAEVAYIRNKGGQVHSIHLADLPAALAAGATEFTEAEARDAAPSLFGTPDPDVEAAGWHDGHGRKVEFSDTGRPAPVTETPEK